MNDVLVFRIGAARPSNILLARLERHANGMEARDKLAVRAERVHTGAGETIVNGTVLIENGMLTAINGILVFICRDQLPLLPLARSA